MLATELVRKQPASGLASGSNGSFGQSPFSASNGRSAPMAIPTDGQAKAGHRDVSSWRGGGSAAFDMRRCTPERGTPPMDGFMRRRTPNQTATQHPQSRDQRVDQQPGIVVHCTVPAVRVAEVDQADLLARVGQVLHLAKVSYQHAFAIAPHQLPSGDRQAEAASGDDDLGEFCLNPPLPVGIEEKRTSVVLHCNSWTDAEAGIVALRNTTLPFPHCATALEAAKERSHSTLVLKNLPFQLQHEELVEELSRLACKPAYVRYYHDERGTFKGIAFAKYETHAEAEAGRFQIDQLAVHGRKIRVEFKHKQQGGRPDSHGRGVPLEQAYEGNGKSPAQSPVVTPQARGEHHPAYTSYDDPGEPDEDEKALEARVIAFAKSDERELVVLKTDPAHVHIRKLCHKHSLRWDHLTDTTVCAHKRGNTPSLSARTTPSMRPALSATTPPFRPLANGSFGVRPNKLAIKHEDIIHCKGPGESDQPFPAGRGRPMPSPKA